MDFEEITRTVEGSADPFNHPGAASAEAEAAAAALLAGRAGDDAAELIRQVEG